MCPGRNAVGGKVDLGAKSRTSHKAWLESCDPTRQPERLPCKNFWYYKSRVQGIGK